MATLHQPSAFCMQQTKCTVTVFAALLQKIYATLLMSEYDRPIPTSHYYKVML